MAIGFATKAGAILSMMASTRKKLEKLDMGERNELDRHDTWSTYVRLHGCYQSTI